MNDPVQEYIDQFDNETRSRLIKIRQLVKQLAPTAIEGFSYSMPSYKLNKKPLIYFAAYKEHIGLYATPNAHAYFKDQLKRYKQGKGSVQFPHNEELPLLLIKEIIEFNIQHLLAK
ncbi:MAG: DUF1801 domain-containing protein [Bacteroidetes bacterium]|nr:MAG: DUF1801 domain-containing protein [Bacteroidota bacterium]